MDIYFRLLLGHIMGDYLLQPLVMAIQKSPRKPVPEKARIKGQSDGSVPIGVAIRWSIIHCLVYTTCVCLWLWTWHPAVFVLIFLTHWPIDFLSLADRWLGFIGGRTMRQADEDTTPFRHWNIAFTAVVYSVTDNGMHLMLMYPVVLALQRGLI